MSSEIIEAIAVQLNHCLDLASVYAQLGFLPHKLCGGIQTTGAVIHSFELLTEFSLPFNGSVVLVIGRFIKTETVIASLISERIYLRIKSSSRSTVT